MNKQETQLEATSHLSDVHSSWWEHALKYFVGATLSGSLIEATPPQAVKHCHSYGKKC